MRKQFSPVLSQISLAILLAFLLYSCRKTDAIHIEEITVDDQQSVRFFAEHTSTDPSINAVQIL